MVVMVELGEVVCLFAERSCGLTGLGICRPCFLRQREERGGGVHSTGVVQLVTFTTEALFLFFSLHTE